MQASALSLPPTDGDLYQCACHIKNITALAGMLNISAEELATLKEAYPDKNVQAVQLLKKWRETTQGSRQELSQFLGQLNMTNAAKR